MKRTKGRDFHMYPDFLRLEKLGFTTMVEAKDEVAEYHTGAHNHTSPPPLKVKSSLRSHRAISLPSKLSDRSPMCHQVVQPQLQPQAQTTGPTRTHSALANPIVGGTVGEEELGI
ncbi:hypothetical protein BT69DRAFT_327828 [Atractiella rhizophila]|nr:hypothetical protein BT69DRAFT_327828 [Atractiella rhizophila]